MPDFVAFQKEGISTKSVGVAGIVNTFASETDVIDLNGFSDAQSGVGSKTAKFSDGSIMKANTGLRIGIVQVKVNAGTPTPRSHVTIDGSFGMKTVAGDSVTVDFGDIMTANLSASINHNCNCSQTTKFEYSTDDIVYMLVGQTTTNSSGQFNISGNSLTYRYAKITNVSINSNSVNFNSITETALPSSTTYNIRSSDTVDIADGTILKGPLVLSQSGVQTFNIDLLFVGDAQFLTLEVVSHTEGDVPITLSEITSVTEN